MNASCGVETYERLREIAEDAGMPVGRLAGELLDELVPTVSGVRRRLQVVRVSENGRSGGG